MTASAEQAPPDRVFERGTDEFGRVLAFSDGLFAIAMTLLVVGIGVPTLQDGESIGDLSAALDDLSPEIISFFISFAVIGRYWVAHHQMFSLLRGFDRGLITLNLIYLVFIAFLPFPTGMLGTYFENPLAVSIYAVAVATVSGMEVVLLRHAHRRGLLAKQMPEDVYRWGRTLSLTPVLFFALSIPAAFVATWLAVVVWFVAGPVGGIMAGRAPAEVNEYFA